MPGYEKAFVGFLAVFAFSSKAQGLFNMQFALVVFRSVVQGSFPATSAVRGENWLEGKSSSVIDRFLCQFSFLLPAHLPSVGEFCRKRADMHCSLSLIFG